MKQLEIRSCGVVTFFTPRECQQATLAAAMRQANLERWVPAQRTERSALECALWDYAKLQCPKERDAEVFPLKQPGQNGFEVLQVERDTVANVRHHQFSCKVDSDTCKITSGWGNITSIQQVYQKHRSTCTSAAVGQCLVKLATELCVGLCLRPSGGLYWIPDDRVEQWELASRIVEQATGSEVTTARWEAKASTIARVKQAIMESVQAECALLMEELTDGKQHSDDWFSARASKALALLGKVTSTEESLEESLNECRAMLDTVRAAFTVTQTAALQW